LIPISKIEAQTILAPYLDGIVRAVTGKINGYYNGPAYAQIRHSHSSRTDASICHDLIKQGIIDEFDGVSGVRFQTKRGLFLFIVKETVLLRFKKFKNNLLSTGVATQQAMSFNLQDTAQLELEGMPPDGLLHVGYIPNALETGVGKIYVTYRFGNHNIWDWDVTINERKIAEQIPFPQTTESVPRRIIKAKGKKNTNVGDVNASNI
jgi:hypothetical protein